jgi:thiol-disulfide isomerase/thioredoxin
VVYLDLWGTWCIQCVAEMPTVQKLYDHYKGDSQVEFLIVSLARVVVHQYESACNVVKKAVGFNYVPPRQFCGSDSE